LKKTLVMEIGTEEIPAKFMPDALKQLREKAVEGLRANRLSFTKLETFGTPRRLVLYGTGIPEAQDDLTEEVRGPSAAVAFDEDGQPTRAALGFARSQGVEVDDLVVKETDGGKYVFAQRRAAGRPSVEVLAEFLPGLVRSLDFPNSMRWGEGDLRFARPIHWILSLLGAEVVPFELAGIRSGRVSFGHRFLGSGPIELKDAQEYFQRLKEEGYVIVSQDERRRSIEEQALMLAREQGGEMVQDPDLLEEVTYLVEYPTVFAGHFPPEYLNLPPEVLVTSMKEHQRYFPVTEPESPRYRLRPVFIAVRNGTSENIDIIRAGNEKVLRARLADAMFFFREDQKISLEERVEKLKEIVFQERLGTLFDKVQRLQRLSRIIAGTLDLGKDLADSVERAAFLCKSDLTTNMVGEFPELQGVMGREYALLDGEEGVVARAIYEHYLPRHAGDHLPQTMVGTVLSLADKLDNIVGCLSLGIQPTGSQDPYGLRRQALGVVRILLNSGLGLSLSKLVEHTIDGYDLELDQGSRDEIKDGILEVFKGRLTGLLDGEGIRYDTIEAVIAAGFDHVVDTFRRARELDRLRSEKTYHDLMTAFRRARNLGQKAERSEVHRELLTEPAEKDLYRSLRETEEKASSQLAQGDYRGYFITVAGIRAPLDVFLDEVLVMDKDEALRHNRLALLKSIADLMTRAADLSEIVYD